MADEGYSTEDSGSTEESSGSEEEMIEACFPNMKLGDDILRSIWLYFGLPSEYIKEIEMPELDDEPFDEEFTFFVAKTAVIDILINRVLYGSLFEVIFYNSTILGKDPLKDLDFVISSIIKKRDYFSAFIRLCSIVGDFILFLRWKGNFLNVDRERLIIYWSEYYDIYFKDPINKHGGMEAFKNKAREEARIYPYYVLARFTSQYCNNGVPYDKNIPTLFKKEILSNYQFFYPILFVE